MTLAGARRRFEAIGAALARPPDPATIRTGFAALAPDDCAQDLIERADRQLIGQRGR